MKITKKIFEKIPNGKVFAVGVIPNSPEGLFMTRDRAGELLLWVAKKGINNDFAIYCNWLDGSTIDGVRDHGNKIPHRLIEKCLYCDEDVLKRYRR